MTKIKWEKKYLKAHEIYAIVEQCLGVQSDYAEFDRELIILGLTAQMCITGLRDKYDNLVDIYNYLMENKIDLEKEIFNLKNVRDIIARETGVSSALGKLSTNILDGLGETPNIEQLQSLVNEYKDVKESITYDLSKKETK